MGEYWNGEGMEEYWNGEGMREYCNGESICRRVPGGRMEQIVRD